MSLDVADALGWVRLGDVREMVEEIVLQATASVLTTDGTLCSSFVVFAVFVVFAAQGHVD